MGVEDVIGRVSLNGLHKSGENTDEWRQLASYFSVALNGFSVHLLGIECVSLSLLSSSDRRHGLITVEQE